MRTIEMKVFNYDELSDEAKETAFERWLESKQNYGYSWSDEISKILKHIEEHTTVRIEDLRYDTCNYSYYLNVVGYHGKDDDKYHVTGLRAAKIVLAMYYNMTQKNQVYARRSDYKGDVLFSYYDAEYSKQTERNRRSPFYKHNDCFTGYCESETFARALYLSIKENTSDDFKVLDHFKVAFDKLFSSVVSDWDAIQSEDYFIENDSDQAEYTEDGEIYSHK